MLKKTKQKRKKAMKKCFCFRNVKFWFRVWSSGGYWCRRIFTHTPMCYDFAFLAAKNNEIGMFLKVLKEKCKQKMKKCAKKFVFSK